MIDAKFFDQDEIVRFGQPFHGLYRGGVLTLPNSDTITPSAPLPVGSDGFMVKIPGRPAVTTSPADADEGMEWLNYAIVSGENHVFYGQALGLNAWIYIAEDESVWRAVATISTGGAASVVLTNVNDTTQTQTVTASCTPAPEPATTAFGNTPYFDDVASHGRSAVFGWRQAAKWNPEPDPFVPWQADPRETRGEYVACWARLDISGIPPAAAAEFALVVTNGNESGVDRRHETASDTIVITPIYHPEFPEVVIGQTVAGTIEQTEVCAMMFDAGDVLRKLVKRSWNQISGYEIFYGSEIPSAGGTTSERRRLEFGGLATATLESTYAWNGVDPARENTTPGGWEQWGDGAIRYSNKCYGLREITAAGAHRFGAFISFGSTLAGWISTGSGWTPVAAAHPESGSIAAYDSGEASFL